MSAEITKYVLVDADDAEGDWEYDTKDEAIAQARITNEYAVIEQTYVYDDSTLVWTPDGSDVWPPEKNDALAEELIKIAAIGFNRPGQAAEAAARIREIVKGETDAGN